MYCGTAVANRVALKVDPTYAIAHYNLGVGRAVDEAINSYETENIVPLSICAYNNMGVFGQRRLPGRHKSVRVAAAGSS